jgi:hypothetical protein
MKKLEHEGKVKQLATEIKIIWAVTLVTVLTVGPTIYLYWF